MEKYKSTNVYLEKANLSGYKSIKDVSIDFKEGLNIIIGKNAAGKTNFLSFLRIAMKQSFDNISSFTTNLIFKNAEHQSLSIELWRESTSIKDIANSNLLNPQKKVQSNIELNGNLVDINYKEHDNFQYSSTFLKHGIPEYLPIINTPFSFNVDKTGSSISLLHTVGGELTTDFTNALITNIFSKLNNLGKNIELNKVLLQNKIDESFNILEKIKIALNKYSLISDLRLCQNFNVFYNDDQEEFTVNNLFLEYRIGGSWHPFSNLSDGTRRLFYIITEIIFSNESVFSDSSMTNFFYKKHNRIILIEEPELGIHPHQLKLLMDFLYNESKRKQIIISTHSPQVLDVLKSNELDRIIIAYMDNGKEGTKLRHLNEPEISKALEYMKEDYLSDYWKHSDLEK